MTTERPKTPIRFTKAKSDASIASIQKTMEGKFGLPKGAVRIVYPSGRKARVDATVGSLRDHWSKRG